jgi:hypothetical protein
MRNAQTNVDHFISKVEMILEGLNGGERVIQRGILIVFP